MLIKVHKMLEVQFLKGWNKTKRQGGTVRCPTHSLDLLQFWKGYQINSVKVTRVEVQNTEFGVWCIYLPRTGASIAKDE
jgi:hypothetical protein